MDTPNQLPVYILAVSGGVDSMVLAETVGAMKTRRSVIAHFDHGIRDNSAQDEAFVREYAKSRGLPYESERVELGANASEQKARNARYDFLHRVREKYGARAIVTAHHQDDVIETMCINLLRGTGWRGLTSLRSHTELIRPLIGMSKAQIVGYALTHGIKWVEDETNEDPRYLRNSIRHMVVPRLSSQQRQELIELYHAQLALRDRMEEELEVVVDLARGREGLSRYWITMLPGSASREVLAYYIGERLESAHLDALLLFAKVARPGKTLTVKKGLEARVTSEELIVYLLKT